MPGATKSRIRELRDADGEAQAATLAAAIAADLAAALTRRAAASLVVSGGRTPAAMLAQLATQRLDWSRVFITLADERWVPPDDAASNEAMVRATLLRDGAAAARFIGLKNDAPSPAAGAARAWNALDVLARPIDVVVLGMGDDGHTASLFPDSPELAAGLDAHAVPGCLAVHPPGAPHARLSLNLAALLQSRRICLQISGARKWQVYQRARSGGRAEELPIRAILRQEAVPVDVYWCPAATEPKP
jgi:6-phosphogluconolactonase